MNIHVSFSLFSVLDGNKNAGFAQKIRVGRVSGNTAVFMFY